MFACVCVCCSFGNRHCMTFGQPKHSSGTGVFLGRFFRCPNWCMQFWGSVSVCLDVD